jgi:hypothetical protein
MKVRIDTSDFGGDDLLALIVGIAAIVVALITIFN